MRSVSGSGKDRLRAMSLRKKPSLAKLLVSAIYREEDRFEEARVRLSGLLGPVERTSDRFDFNLTDYYEEEMGAPLFRRFLVMEERVPRDFLASAKLQAEEVEALFSSAGKRTVNLDPGILSEENFLLATGKNFSHRIYLRDGVFADLTLIYRKGEYLPLPWTYPDYSSRGIRTFLAQVREGLRRA